MRCLGRLLLLFGFAVAVVIVVALVAVNGSKDKGSDAPAGGVRPAPYQVARDDDVSIAGRSRYNVDIVMDPTETDAAVQAGLADAVRDGFSRHPNASVIVVFAHSDQSLVNTGADVGRAFASTDGGGLGGSNSGLLGPDAEGIIQVEIHSMSNDAVQSMTKL
jgi:hypothetical protein